MQRSSSPEKVDWPCYSNGIRLVLVYSQLRSVTNSLQEKMVLLGNEVL